jgi:hypothetical protein
VLSNPTEQKYAQIKTNNATMKRTVLDVKGGQDYLVAVSCGNICCFTYDLTDHQQCTSHYPTPSSSTIAAIHRDLSERRVDKQMGFRSRTISFTQSFVLEPFPLRPGMKHGLELGVEVLEAHVSPRQGRSRTSKRNGVLTSELLYYSSLKL